MSEDTRHHVVIAGGGVAGLEALIGLHKLAKDRVRVTLLAPTDEFLIRALSVQDPFARPAPQRYSLEQICRDHDAEFRRGAIASVRPADHAVVTDGSDTLHYDSLMVAIGARPVPAFEHALTFRGLQDAEAMHGLIEDLEGDYVHQIAFVVPPGTTWPLPLYELALMTAERAYGMQVNVGLTIVTPEPQPLAIFGGSVSDSVDRMLAARDIVVRTSCNVTSVEGGVVTTSPGGAEVRAQRVVALPRLEGPGLQGLPSDADGFLPVDEHGRAEGAEDVYGAGDGTTSPIKQGGIAAQQAGAALRSIAAEAGAGVHPKPFRPVLRAELLTGSRSTFLRQAVGADGDQGSVATDEPLWWPPSKVVAPFLAPYLEQAGRPASGRSSVP
jgi:sulfide:quinone oxidoreductase